MDLKTPSSTWPRMDRAASASWAFLPSNVRSIVEKAPSSPKPFGITITAVRLPRRTAARRASASSASGTLKSGSPPRSPFSTDTRRVDAWFFAWSTMPTLGGAKLPKSNKPKTTIITVGKASDQKSAARSRKNIFSSATMNAP